jgi:hypothetical protein
MDCPDVCLDAFWLQEWEWVFEDCHKRSCWKNSIGMSVPRPCGSDMYMCSKSCWLCLTVVYWLLECNKVPSWIEPPSTLQYAHAYRTHIHIQCCKLLTNSVAPETKGSPPRSQEPVKVSVQVRGRIEHFVTNWFFTVGGCYLPFNPQAGGPPTVCCPRLLTQYVRSYPPYQEAVSSIRNLRARHAVVTWLYTVTD